MTTFSKILALITTAACFAFLGFVAVTLIGGPNWVGEANNYPNYVFEYTPGENPTWGVKRRDNDQAVGSPGPVLPKKITEVLNQVKQEQQAKIGLLDNGNPETRTPGIAALETYVKETTAFRDLDINALSQQQTKLQADLTAVREELIKTSGEVTDTVTSIEAIFNEAERRRGDIYRLQNLVVDAETDRYRAINHQEKLRDTWERYQGVIDRLKQRKAILSQQLEQKQRFPYEATPAGT